MQLAGGLGNQILEKLDKLNEPWFYFIHLMDLHAPFYLPEEFDKEEFGDTKHDRMISYIDTWIGKFLEKIDLEKSILVLTSDHGDYISILEEDLNKIKIPKAFKKTKEEGRRERRENALFEVKKLIPREGLHRARNLPETQKLCIQAIKFRQKMINRIIEARKTLDRVCRCSVRSKRTICVHVLKTANRLCH